MHKFMPVLFLFTSKKPITHRKENYAWHCDFDLIIQIFWSDIITTPHHAQYIRSNSIFYGILELTYKWMNFNKAFSCIPLYWFSHSLLLSLVIIEPPSLFNSLTSNIFSLPAVYILDTLQFLQFICFSCMWYSRLQMTFHTVSVWNKSPHSY